MLTQPSHRQEAYLHCRPMSRFYLKIILLSFLLSSLHLSTMVQSHQKSPSLGPLSLSKSLSFSSSNVYKKILLPNSSQGSLPSRSNCCYPNNCPSLRKTFNSKRCYLFFLSSYPAQMILQRNIKKMITNVNENTDNMITDSIFRGSRNRNSITLNLSTRSGSGSLWIKRKLINGGPIVTSRGNSYNNKHPLFVPLQRIQSKFAQEEKSNILTFSATTPNGDYEDFNERDTSSNSVKPSPTPSPITPLSPSPTEEKDSDGNLITQEVAEGVFTSLFENDRRPVILFDGICAFCNGGINLLSDLDKTKNLRFATLQSDLGKSLLVYCNRAADDISSIVVIERNGLYHTRSDAMLTILENTYMFPPTNDNSESSTTSKTNRIANLTKEDLATNNSSSLEQIGIRNFLISFLLPSVGRKIPRFLRDGAYEVVSENRYRFLGVKDECRIIDEDEDDRFLA